MNKFFVVLCVALVASASAKPGYNYQQPQKAQPGPALGGNFKQQSFRPSQPASNNAVFSVVQSPPLASFSAPAPVQVNLPPAPAPAPQFSQQYTAPPPQYVPPVQQQFVAPAPAVQQQQFVAPAAQQQQQFVAPAAQQQQQFVSQPSYQPHPQPQQQVIISKDIFIHSAPEEVEEIGNAADTPLGPVRKNYRIVFIKAPSQNLKLNLDSLKRAQASNEEKTVIYVLSKKPDLKDLQNQLSVVQNEQKSHKPEVFFIKYRTQEEANRAQQEIQAQYDSLGGSTHISDEGVAPVTSVIGGGVINVGNAGTNLGGNFGTTSFQGGSAGGSLGSNLGSATFQGGNSFGQQQQFVQQSFQSSSQSSVGATNFATVPSQKYLPAKKK
uniref:DUF243 domain-containing protein n=1 Tax=Musca domestica TaxID=7370 RepID=A0A1I8NHC8_MUSDO